MNVTVWLPAFVLVVLATVALSADQKSTADVRVAGTPMTWESK